MEKPIRHVHVRRFEASLPRVVAAVDVLWSGQPDDALPPALHGWRSTPRGATGFAAGTRFGHGPFSFMVEAWDGRSLRARIETRGFRGHHGFELVQDGAEVVITHDLDAQLLLPQWLFWQGLVASSHDWAVEAMFDRLHVLLGDGRAARTQQDPPLRMRAFARIRRLQRGRSATAGAASRRS